MGAAADLRIYCRCSHLACVAGSTGFLDEISQEYRGESENECYLIVVILAVNMLLSLLIGLLTQTGNSVNQEEIRNAVQCYH